MRTLDEQLAIISRGTEDIISKEHLVKKLARGTPLNIKFGVDPTAPDIHLGHTVPLQKLKQFQDLGHNITLVIGNYTAMIGDPSGKSETRPMLSAEDIEKNVATYTDQVFKILDSNSTQVVYNDDWLGELSSAEMVRLASKYTVQQLLQRRDFGKRFEEHTPISVCELMYPLLVGYDSVVLKTDIELGGTDQLFNFMASRDIQAAYGQESEVIITLPILEGLDGVKKMSKSLGNAIGVREEPKNMYGKLMSISDDLMVKYFELISDVSPEKLVRIRDAVQQGTENPMRYKKELAREIVTRFHGEQLGLDTELDFQRVFSRRQLPENIPQYTVTYQSTADLGVSRILRNAGYATSNNEARRLIEQGAVEVNGVKIQDTQAQLDPEDETVIKVGKRGFKQLYFQKS